MGDSYFIIQNLPISNNCIIIYFYKSYYACIRLIIIEMSFYHKTRTIVCDVSGRSDIGRCTNSLFIEFEDKRSLDSDGSPSSALFRLG